MNAFWSSADVSQSAASAAGVPPPMTKWKNAGPAERVAPVVGGIDQRAQGRQRADTVLRQRPGERLGGARAPGARTGAASTLAPGTARPRPRRVGATPRRLRGPGSGRPRGDASPEPLLADEAAYDPAVTAPSVAERVSRQIRGSGVRNVPADAAPPRPVLLARRSPASPTCGRGARALRVRSRRRRDRRQGGRGSSRARAERRSTSGRTELERGLASGRSAHRVIAALVDAARRFDLPLAELRPYIASMRMDCGRLRIQTRDELDRYMEGSGGSVGRIMAAILGAPAEGERLARLGVAFQLTNFLRDVREDYGLDRIYLPADERERLGVGEDDLAAATATPALRELVAAEVQRARALFAETTPALRAAIPSARRGIAPRARRLLRRPRPDRARTASTCSAARRGRWLLGPRARPVRRDERPRPGIARRRAAGCPRSAARASPAWRSRASSPGPAPTCSSSIATRSARIRPRPAPCRCRGSGRSGSRARSGRSSRS